MAQLQSVMPSATQLNDEHPLFTFLGERRTKPGQEPTMTETTNSTLKGKFTIPDKDYEEFLDLLHEYLFVDKRSPLGVVERDKTTKTSGEKPLLIDLDFKYPTTMNLTRKFNERHIRAFIRQIVSGLEAFYDLSSYDDDGIRFFVCLRPIPSRTGEKAPIKDGIHIESPDFTLTNEKQKVLRSWILEQHAVKECFEDTGYTEKDEKVYDESLTRSQGWYFYGESKANIPPYQLTQVFHYDPVTEELTQETDIHTKYPSRDLMEILSIRYKVVPDNNEIKAEAKDLYKRLLNWKATTPSLEGATGGAVPELSLSTPTEMDVIVRSLNARNKPGATPEDSPLIRRLVMECLSQDRVEDYGTWMEVAWCLHHIATTPEMSDQMFDLWMEWSKQSSKSSGNNETQLRRDWNRMSRPTSQRVIKWGSLNYWARTDNPTKYAEIMEEDLIQYIAVHTMNTHFHIATIMAKMYGYRYKASIDSKRTEWFMFREDEHIWKHINQGIELRGKISNELVEKITKAKDRIKAQCRGDDGELSEYGQKRIKEFLAVEKSLYTAGFKDNVLKECAGLFYEEDFMTRLNLNPYLLVCANGVLNLRATRKGADGKDEHFVEFRPGRPEDMMSFIAGREFGISEAINYIPYDPDDVVQAEIEDFMTKIFPRADLRQFVTTLLASCLEGMNREQAYYTLIGVGGNGKSKIIELMRMVLGEYQTGLAPTALTRKRPDSGAANPDIISIKNRRLIYLQEPDDREPLNTSRMKQFSGEDVVEARGLFADQEKFKISGKLMMLCNNLPPIHAMDRGTWRRIRVIPFESKFVKEGDIGYEDLVAGKPNVFPKDVFLDEKLKQWREGFLGLLVWTYENIYCKVGLKEPAIVRQASMDYKNQFDSFAKFKEARIVQVVGERTEFNKITRAYRNWVEWQGGTSKRLTTQDLRKRCEEEFGAPEEGKLFRGIVVFDDEEAMELWRKTNA
jgi:P4 family phage/plasmid primase-like protien